MSIIIIPYTLKAWELPFDGSSTKPIPPDCIVSMCVILTTKLSFYFYSQTEFDHDNEVSYFFVVFVLMKPSIGGWG